MDLLPAIPTQLLTGAGWGALVLTLVWMLFTDKLVTRGSHLREMKDKDDHIVYLRRTLEVREEQVRIRDEQMQKLLTNSDLTLAALQAIATEAHRGDLAS